MCRNFTFKIIFAATHNTKKKTKKKKMGRKKIWFFAISLGKSGWKNAQQLNSSDLAGALMSISGADLRRDAFVMRARACVQVHSFDCSFTSAWCTVMTCWMGEQRDRVWLLDGRHFGTPSHDTMLIALNSQVLTILLCTTNQIGARFSCYSLAADCTTYIINKYAFMFDDFVRALNALLRPGWLIESYPSAFEICKLACIQSLYLLFFISLAAISLGAPSICLFLLGQH